MIGSNLLGYIHWNWHGYKLYLPLIIFARHREINGKIYKAVHVYLPGYIEVGKPADTFELKPWCGTKLKDFSMGIKGKDEKDTLSMEANAFLALKMTPILDSTYDLKLIGKDFVAISPEKSWKEWSWKAHYRLSSWKLDKENN